MGLSEADHKPGKPGNFVVQPALFPFHPACGVVLAVSVVVAVLRISEFIPGQDQRHSLGSHQDGPGIPQLFFPQLQDLPFPCRSLRAAVPAVIIIGPVPAVLSVLFIVLPVIGDHIHHGESIGIGHEIHLSEGASVFLHVIDQVPELVLISLDKPPHIGLEVVPVYCQIPFLSRALPAPVPREQLDAPQHRILGDRLSVKGSRDMDPVHMVFLHPEPETVQNIGRARVGFKIKLHRDFQSVFMELFHQGLKLDVRCPVLCPAHTVSGLGREAAGRTVAPVIELSAISGSRKNRCHAARPCCRNRSIHRRRSVHRRIRLPDRTGLSGRA